MTQICTTIEQSKKLLELGLSEKTSDMCWSLANPDLPTLLAFPIVDSDNRSNDKIPAWSLSALFELMPELNDKPLKMERVATEYEPKNYYYFIEYQNIVMFPYCKTAIDACVKIVEWLLKHNYIKNEKT